MTVPRTMLGFHRDDEGEWVADLDCGHGRHVRHRPPLSSYPWVQTATGRDEHVGQSIECGRCAMRTWPEGFERYKSTKIFDAATVPKGLLGDHRTRAGVWGELEVLEGHVTLVFAAPLDHRVEVTSAGSAAIPPDLPHCVEVHDGGRFVVHFHRRAAHD